jgi:hypothetical protein
MCKRRKKRKSRRGMNRNTKHYVRNSYTPTYTKEGEETNNRNRIKRRGRVTHRMHIFSKDVLEK